MAARAPKITPSRFTPIAVRYAAMSIVSTCAVPVATPALRKIRSRPPYAFSAKDTAAREASGSRTSVRWNRPSTSAAAASPAVSSKSATTTR